MAKNAVIKKKCFIQKFLIQLYFRLFPTLKLFLLRNKYARFYTQVCKVSRKPVIATWVGLLVRLWFLRFQIALTSLIHSSHLQYHRIYIKKRFLYVNSCVYIIAIKTSIDSMLFSEKSYYFSNSTETQGLVVTNSEKRRDV